MSRSIVRRVGRLAVQGLGGMFVLVGITTGAALHVQARRALDGVLAAAAEGEAHPWEDPRWAVPELGNPVEVALWRPDAPAGVPPDAVEAARAAKEARYLDLGDERILLLPIAPDPGAEAHTVVVARAPRVRLADSVGPFGLAYGGFGSLLVALSAWALRRELRATLAPLERVAAAVDRAQGEGAAARVPETGAAEVDRLVAAVNALLGRLERAFEAQAGFTAQAAHELRTPVAALLGEVDLALRRERSAPEYRAALEAVRADALALQRRVGGLMALAQVDAGQVETARVWERPSAIVHGALQAEREALAAAGCAVSVVAEADPELRVHGPLLQIAVGTLLRNVAVHAPGAPVEVRQRGVAGGLEILVRDRGPGPARGAGGGLGLGLPLAREIVARHGGTLHLRPRDGGGTEVALRLPAPDSHEPPMEG